MVNFLPAVLIGGSPHAGKSVLFHSLTHALRKRGVRHHAIRACPDGEGNWSQESDQNMVGQIRKPIKGVWPDSFVKRVCQDLERRCLPFLVDMGGNPKESQLCLLRQCTHSILLLRDDEPGYTQFWSRLVEENGLTPLARIFSQKKGTSTIISQVPIIEGTLTGLVRDNHAVAEGPLFDALVEQIATLFNSYSLEDLERVIFEQAPKELLNLYDLVPATGRWQPEMLPPLLANLPDYESLSIYGVAPTWVYAMIAAYTECQAFHQFDPRIGWLEPLMVQLSTDLFPEIAVTPRSFQDVTVLAIEIPSKHLDYFQPEPLPFPPIRTNVGLIIHGVMPLWLLTALVRLYKEAGVAWIALYEPRYEPDRKAVVAYSRVATYTPGDLVGMPHL